MTTHGHRSGNWKSPTYISWQAMIARCFYRNHPFYSCYGGRGITVCDRWRGEGGFERFLEDVGERPYGRTLDRVDVEGNYEPENVRWATLIEQRWNRRDMANVSQNGQFADTANTAIRETATPMPF